MKKCILASLLIVGNSIKAEIDEQVFPVVTAQEKERKMCVELHGEEIVQKIERLQQEYLQEQDNIHKEFIEKEVTVSFQSLFDMVQVILKSVFCENNSEIQEAFKEAQEEGTNKKEATQKVMNMFHDLIKQNCGQSDLRCIKNQIYELEEKSKWVQLFEKIVAEERKILFSKELNTNK